MRYAIVIEKAEGNYSAYVPDLPGCVAPAALPPRRSPKSERPSRFTSTACAKMVSQSPNRKVRSNTT